MTVTHGFELLKEAHIAELHTDARLYRHRKTGAELLSLVNDDENKSFGINFRTPPADSTGVAHIMEHAVLCGSAKYPAKEPFVELLKGSLKTFLNAFTYPDKTCYPLASQNTQDFYNLIDVYMDAVLHPLIPRHTFEQEGWHYELEDPDAPLVYKGVVFNEMKGAYSSPDGLLDEYTQQAIFPNHTYGFDSGGNPRHIPDLTYEQFKAFHQTYYHPSNARIYFYGDDDPDTRLRLMNEYLQEFEAQPVDSDIPLQAPFDAPRRVSHPFAATETDDKAMLTVNWLLTESTDVEASMALGILSYILVGTPASPLRKRLLDSGLGEDLTGGGTNGHLRQLYFSTGMKGVAAENIDRVETLIHDTLADLADNGIDPEMIEAAMNTLEFRLREQNTGHFPRGLALMLSALNVWLYDGDPFTALAFETSLNHIKSRLADDPAFFQRLIKAHLLDNPHRVTVVLTPDGDLQQREEAAEAQRLAEVKAGLSQADRQAIIDNTQTLKKLQETPDPPEALAAIPHLSLDDIDRQSKTIPIEVQTEQNAEILYHDLFTNGIVYLDLGFNLKLIPQDLLPYVSLFSDALTEIGTDSEDFVKLSQRIGRKTGGIWSTYFTSTRQNRAESTAWLFVRSKATMAQVDDLLAILRDLLLHTNFDNPERFRQMVLEDKAGKEAGLIPGGHGIVSGRLQAHFSEAAWLSETMGGIENLFFVRQLARDVEENWPAVLEKLEAIRRVLLNRNAMLCNVTLDADNWATFRPKLAAFLGDLPAAPVELARWTPAPLPPFEGLSMPAQVNYVGKGASLFDLGYQMHGSIFVIQNYLRSTWLWEKVRVQGGAYGGLSSFDQQSGLFTFLSYRDPNLLDTLAVYDRTAGFLRGLELSQSELSKSIIGTISSIDSYRLPDAKGRTSMIRYLTGYTDDIRQKIREEVLSTTAADFHAFADVLEAVSQNGHVVVLGSADALNKANAEKGDWLSIKKVM